RVGSLRVSYDEHLVHVMRHRVAVRKRDVKGDRRQEGDWPRTVAPRREWAGNRRVARASRGRLRGEPAQPAARTRKSSTTQPIAPLASRTLTQWRPPDSVDSPSCS